MTEKTISGQQEEGKQQDTGELSDVDSLASSVVSGAPATEASPRILAIYENKVARRSSKKESKRFRRTMKTFMSMAGLVTQAISTGAKAKTEPAVARSRRCDPPPAYKNWKGQHHSDWRLEYDRWVLMNHDVGCRMRAGLLISVLDNVTKATIETRYGTVEEQVGEKVEARDKDNDCILDVSTGASKFVTGEERILQTLDYMHAPQDEYSNWKDVRKFQFMKRKQGDNIIDFLHRYDSALAKAVKVSPSIDKEDDAMKKIRFLSAVCLSGTQHADLMQAQTKYRWDHDDQAMPYKYLRSLVVAIGGANDLHQSVHGKPITHSSFVGAAENKPKSTKANKKTAKKKAKADTAEVVKLVAAALKEQYPKGNTGGGGTATALYGANSSNKGGAKYQKKPSGKGGGKSGGKSGGKGGKPKGKSKGKGKSGNVQKHINKDRPQVPRCTTCGKLHVGKCWFSGSTKATGKEGFSGANDKKAFTAKREHHDGDGDWDD